MLSFLPPFLRGCLAALLLGLNILLLSLPLMLVSVSRFLIPVKPWRRFSIRVCTRIADMLDHPEQRLDEVDPANAMAGQRP